MHNYEFGPTSGPGTYNDSEDKGHSAFSLVLLIVGIVVAAAIGLTVVFWAIGLLFSVAALALRVVVIVALAAFVWRRVTHGRSRRCDY